MTKRRLARLGVVAAAAVAFALPASSAHAEECVYYGTFPLVCVPDSSG